MFDTKKLLDQFLGQGGPAMPAGGNQGGQQQGGGLLDAVPDGLKGFGGGLAAGGLAGLVLGGKSGRKMAGKAAKYGGMALLGGLAYKAYSDWQASKATAPAGGSVPSVPSVPPAPALPPAETVSEAEGTRFLPAPGAERNALGVKLIQAMIAAAKADGHIDAEEQKRIFAKLDAAELGMEEKAFLMDELRKPLDIDAIVKLAGNEEEAVEIYVASCVAIEPDDAAEQAYLAMLSARLKLAPDLKATIDRDVAAALLA